MNELHLFAGAGGGILGGILLGHTPVCAVEIEPYCRKVLLQRQRDGILPKFPIWNDVTTFDGTPWRGKVDVVCGGFPCQDISSAGGGAGIEGERSGLWAEMLRVISEIRPSYVFTENSPMLTIRGGLRVIAELTSMGYDSSWGIIGAKHCGGAIARDRMWIYSRSCKINREINAERKSELFRWPYKVNRNLGDNFKTRSLVDRFVEELDREGERREKQRECDLPPYLFRVDNGMASELDELAAIGNGQVPIVAATAWKILGGKLK